MPDTPAPSAAPHELIHEVYNNLRALAADRLNRLPPGQTLQPTALVHEVYLKLIKQERFHDAAHFFHAAAVAMRHLLVDAARRKHAGKHGGLVRKVPLTDSHDVEHVVTLGGDPDELLALNDALTALETEDPQCAQVVMLRCFAGLTNQQTAAALQLDPAQADRTWRFARSFLRHRMCGESA